MTTPVDDEFTELVDADIPRVDLVDKAANGLTFLLAKRGDGAAGLMDPAFVRDLIGETDPIVKADEGTVTMSGSPAAIVKLIHEAAQRAAGPVEKAKYNADDLRRMAASGAAMKDESYPIEDRDDLDRAIRAVGRGGADHDAIRRHVITRAKALGASSEIPDNWNADGSLKGSVTKESDTMADEDLDVSTVLAEPDEQMPGMDTDPGSPAWEAIDAATARKWTSILARAKNALGVMEDREMLEAAAGEAGDALRAADLSDACCAIDYAISILAPFAVAEQAEADCGEEMAMVGKALAEFDTAPLDILEALGPVRKAGRVLSAANEAAIRGAVESLQKVLASLPAAPEAVEKSDSGQPAADEKESSMPEPITSAETVAESGQQPQMGIAKADGEKTPMVVVYDQKGRLIGIVDPADVTPVANSEADPDDSATEPAAEPDGDMQPAPADQVGTPADAVPDGVTKTEQTTTTEQNDGTTDTLVKGIADVVKAALETHSATQQQALAAMADDLKGMAEANEVLKAKVQALEEQPAEPKVFTNGAVPPAHHLRGQDRGSTPVDVAKAAELKQVLYKGTAEEQNDAFAQMQAMAVAKLQELHQR